MEIDGVKAAESGDINKAIELFSQAISVAPSYASAYNNRAQAYRLINEPESTVTCDNVFILDILYLLPFRCFAGFE